MNVQTNNTTLKYRGVVYPDLLIPKIQSGDYSFVKQQKLGYHLSYDTKQLGFHVVDRFASLPLFYVMHNGRPVVSEVVEDLLPYLSSVELDPVGYYTTGSSEKGERSDRTPIKGILRIPPGHYLEYKNSINEKGLPIIPADVTQKAIYLVRNPLDVVASYANHSHVSNEQSVKMMNKANGYLARQKNGLNINNQLPQLMYSWSGHVNSWHKQTAIEVETIRYEDMKIDPLSTFSRAVKAMGLECTEEQIANAIELTKFDKLKKAEEAKGFKEKNIESPSFFRKGKMGGYKEELSPELITSICEAHGETMQQFGYAIPILEMVKK